MNKLNKPKTKITSEIAAVIKKLLLQGYDQHDIAALLGVNQGRISEINTGKKFADVSPAT